MYNVIGLAAVVAAVVVTDSLAQAGNTNNTESMATSKM
jgi:hypothetical protein